MGTLQELCDQALAQYAKTLPSLGDEEKDKVPEERIKEFGNQVKLLKGLMDPFPRKAKPKISLPMNEVLSTTDASILFPRVIQDILMKPVEPMYIGQSILAKTIHVDNVTHYTFPAIGAIRAFQVGEGQEYRSQGPGFTEHAIEIGIQRWGLVLDIYEDVIKDSRWDILGLYVEAAGRAMSRAKEENIFNVATQNATVVYDNSIIQTASGGSADAVMGWTTGKKSDGLNANGTLSLDDLINTIAALMANGYTPTDVIIHPLAWTIFSTNPILRAHSLFGGQIGQQVWTAMGPDSVSANLPWNMQVTVTPFAPMRLNTYAYTAADVALSTISGAAAANWTDIMVLDRSSSLLVMQRDDPSTEEWRDPKRDIQSFKIKERYGVGCLNAGKNITMLKNVKVAKNYEISTYVGNVTVA